MLHYFADAQNNIQQFTFLDPMNLEELSYQPVDHFLEPESFVDLTTSPPIDDIVIEMTSPPLVINRESRVVLHRLEDEQLQQQNERRERGQGRTRGRRAIRGRSRGGRPLGINYWYCELCDKMLNPRTMNKCPHEKKLLFR